MILKIASYRAVMPSLCCPKQSQVVYKPRRPEKTVLFEVIKKHYSTWCKNSKKTIPQYVNKEFQNYLGCGILSKGFACAHCDSCHKDFLIAFSCKGRGICPSCNTRAMVETAAHLIENVIPCVPIRQFVISFPMRIRHYLQTPSILQSVLRIVVDEIRKKLIACSPSVFNPHIGAISFIQLRYCARPCFASENLRRNGPWLIYRLPKPTHKGQTFIQLEPLEFLEKIANFLPYPRRHRRHYHVVFAPNSPLRKQVAANSQNRIESVASSTAQEVVDKIEKVSFNWAKLIARIYETNPLICGCGKEIKITRFVVHPAEIQRILNIGWPIEVPEFDPFYNLTDFDISQLIPGTEDGFAQDEPQFHGETGPDPPFLENHKNTVVLK